MIGILLSHKYSSSEYKNKIYKGIDSRLLYSLQNKCEILNYIPVLVHVRRSTDYDGLPDKSENIQDVYRFTNNDIEVAANKMKKCHGEYTPLEYKDISFLSIGAPSETLNIDDKSYIEFTGNEAQPGLFDGKYFNMAVILKQAEQLKWTENFMSESIVL
jgi:hypothetical protein